MALAAQREAERSVLDLTRNIQRKKEKELAALQIGGRRRRQHYQDRLEPV